MMMMMMIDHHYHHHQSFNSRNDRTHLEIQYNRIKWLKYATYKSHYTTYSANDDNDLFKVAAHNKADERRRQKS